MKKGKVLCIKYVWGYQSKPIFIEGETYNWTDSIFKEGDGRHLYNVYYVNISKGEYLYFKKEDFEKHFKTLKQIRKEKIEKINER